MPALRDRSGDVDVLVSHFKAACERKSKLAYPAIDEPALALLREHVYPGNVRELEMLIERMALEGSQVTAEALMVMLQDLGLGANQTSEQELPEDLVSTVRLDQAGRDLKSALAQFETRLIEEALQRCGTRAKAAEFLKVPKRTLADKMKRLDLEGY